MPHNGEHKVAGYSGLSGRMHRNTQLSLVDLKKFVNYFT